MSKHGARLLLLLIGAALLVGSHGFALYWLSAHAALSAGMMTGVVVLALLKHLGLLAPISAMFRRRQH
jgi:hypothetical protein